MRNDLFYKQIKENALNKPVIGIFEKYANTHADFQMYIITAPLGEKYEYQYEDRALIVLVPSHKLLFINLSDEEESFLDYVEDVIQDLNSMSDKYKYLDFIGRARKWKDEIVEKVQYNDANFDLENNCVRTHIPTEEQQHNINRQILELQADQAESYQEILDDVFAEFKITDIRKQEQITKALDTTPIDKLDKDMIRKFVKTNLSFYS